MIVRVALVCSFLAGCAHRATSTVQALPVDASRTVATPASRYPVSPSSLDATAMYESYPREAREAAASGVAIVRIDLSAAGEVTDVTVLREDPAGYGFGDGCANVIRANASGWQPALDANGRPIAHRLSYRCVFDARADAARGASAAEPPRYAGEAPPDEHREMLTTYTSDDTPPPAPRAGAPAQQASPPASLDDAALRSVFPVSARRAGVSGRVVVRVSLDAEGHLSDVGLVRETPTGYGFADACIRVLRERGATWRPAFDAAGAPMATSFPFICTFDVHDPQPPPSE